MTEEELPKRCGSGSSLRKTGLHCLAGVDCRLLCLLVGLQIFNVTDYTETIDSPLLD